MTSPGGAAVSPSSVAAVQRLAFDEFISKSFRHLRSSRSNPQLLPDLCFALARIVDAAVKKNMTPSNPHELFLVLKEVWQHNKNAYAMSAIMVLMISIKDACKRKWFQVEDSNELLTMADEISRRFGITDRIFSETSDSFQVMSRIMERYYPQLVASYFISFFEVKTGYNILVSSFNIKKDVTPPESIRLFVAQKDNTETSSCLVTPAQVNFLINGKYVEGRTNIFTDNGPQLPTDITRMVKSGTNLVQAIGSFTGDYIIAVAVMCPSKTSDVPVLLDYVKPLVPEDKTDSEVIEGASRIPLICPISFQRVKLPVKGHLCRHYQCFDYDSFMEINSRKPTWRCPLCNQPVNYADIRIDKDMVKILEDVGESASAVFILNDGSWRVLQQEDGASSLEDTSNKNQHNGLNVCNDSADDNGEQNKIDSSSPAVVDLTMDGDSEAHAHEWKPCQTLYQDAWLTHSSGLDTTFDSIQYMTPNSTETSSQLSLPVSAHDASNLADLYTHINNIQDHLFNDSVMSTVDTDYLGNLYVSSSGHNEPSVSLSMDNLLPNIEPAVASPSPLASRSYSTNHQRPRTEELRPNSIMPSWSSTHSSQPCPPQATVHDGIMMMNNGAAYQLPCNFSLSYIPGQQRQVIQQPRQIHQNASLPILNSTTMSFDRLRNLPHINFQNSNQQLQYSHSPQPMGQVRQTNPFHHSHNLPQFASAAHRNRRPANLQSQTAGQYDTVQACQRRSPVPSVPAEHIRTFSRVPAPAVGHHQVTGSDGLLGDKNWQSTGRMRGSLTGRAYVEALERYAAQPTERPHTST